MTVKSTSQTVPVDRRGSGTPSLRLQALQRRYEDFVAVDAIDLEIAEGEFFSLLGPSGCGKTTTLRMIAGLEEPSSGAIELEGEPITKIPAHRRQVNTVFQNYALFPHLSVFDNVAFGLRERRLPKAEIRQRVGEMLEFVDLGHRGDAKPDALSGGQQQRVALARALVLRPRLLLLDEPLGALDLKLRKRMQLLLKEIQNEVGITFVYVTHDQEEAFFMSDRVAVMRNGRIEQVASPSEVYVRPTTAFVADFVGTSNQIEGRVAAVDGDGRYDVDLLGHVCRGVPGVPGLAAGDEVVTIVRPEVLSFVDEPDPRALRGRIVDVAFLGPQTFVEVAREDGGGAVTVALPSRHLRDGRTMHVGDEGYLAWPIEHAWVVPRP
ncbi:ABC transporter ATP-binding protein [Patulibacter defluvii]|uniref:ABC transporter ATP-binding protein n=1 Tax=Patulibacter defluvii TaxID=3095358 RepID=UPI002A7515AC|nr:ABC transporter ATP-binding protein [Patulibacter sp. DM4]